MGNPFDDVIEFNKRCGVPTLAECDNAEDVTKNFTTSLTLIEEEFKELMDSTLEFVRSGLANPTSVNDVAKEGIDLIYVIVGFLYRLGVPIKEVFDEVHNSNMTKLVDGKPVKREDGKVLKGPNYLPPDLDKLKLPVYSFSWD